MLGHKHCSALRAWPDARMKAAASHKSRACADGEGRCRAAAPRGLVRRPHRGDLAPLRDLLVVGATAAPAPGTNQPAHVADDLVGHQFPDAAFPPPLVALGGCQDFTADARARQVIRSCSRVRKTVVTARKKA
jgi:hypothetical protein